MSRNLLIVLALSISGLYYVAPTLVFFGMPKNDRNVPEKVSAAIPNWLPQQHIKLGLDIQGGVQLVLGVNTDDAVISNLNRMGTEISRWAEENSMPVKTAYVVKGEQMLRVEFSNVDNMGPFREKIRDEFPQLEQKAQNSNHIDYGYNNDQMASIKKSAEEQAERVIRTRIDKWGVSEPIINRRADGSVLVQLPGFSNPEKAKELLGRTAQLQFKIVDEAFTAFTSIPAPEGVDVEGGGTKQKHFVGEDKEALTKLLSPLVPKDRNLIFEREEIAGGNKYRYRSYVVKAAIELSGEDIIDTNVTSNGSGLDNAPAVGLRFTGPGGKRFADITGANVGKRMAIVLDNEIVSAPNINGRIPGGSAIITLGTGNRQKVYEEALGLSLILKSGALPATIVVLEERQVGASLGPELAEQGVRAILLGLGLVLCFMLFYYRIPGILACSALLLNAIFLMAIMAGFGSALTLPGIAGFILTLGMAVDANVLINERIRQEIRGGHNAKKAITDGFNKVYWTIVDANVTTLIAALVLLETNSSGPIRGFAITLIIGLTVSLFTSLFCTRTFFDALVKNETSDKKIRGWFGGDKKVAPVKFNFLHYGKLAAGIAAAIIIGVVISGSTKGFNWAVDFEGGMEMEVAFSQDVDPKEIREAVGKAGVKSLVLQALEGGSRKFLLRFDNADETDKSFALEVAKRIKDNLGSANPDILKSDFVGPQIGKEMRTNGILSIFWALLGVFAYVGLRFDLRFAPGAIVKMVVDVFVILGFYAFFWRSFDLTSVAALLTVVGYSVNDAIVIYDRIRENLISHPRRTLWDNINGALGDTLSRTINTSLTTILALVGILIFGTSQLWNFAAAMSIGVIAATLSSMFLASSMVVWLEMKKNRKVKTA